MGLNIDDPFVEENSHVPPISAGRVFEASVDLAVGDRETSVISKFIARESLEETGPKLSVDELGTKYPDLQATFPMTEQGAVFELDLKKEREGHEAIMQAAGDSFWKGTALPFIGGSMSAMADPIGFAVGTFTGWGLGKVAQRQVSKSVIKSTGGKGLSELKKNVFRKSITKGVKLSPHEKIILDEITDMTSLKGGKKFALDVFDNMIGNGLSETLVWKDKDQSFQEYTANDFFQNAIAGSILVTGAMHGGSKTLKLLGKMGDVQLKTNQDMVDVMIDEGKNLDMIDESIKIQTKVAEHSTHTTAAMEGSFGDKVDVGEDMVDAMKNIKEAHAEGKITDAEVDGFMKKVEEDQNIDSRALEMGEGKQFKHTPEEELELIKMMEKKEDSVVAKANEAMDGYDPEASDKIISDEIDELFADAEVKAEVKVEGDVKTEGKTEVAPKEEAKVKVLDPETAKIKQEMQKNLKIVEAQEAYLKCRVG